MAGRDLGRQKNNNHYTYHMKSIKNSCIEFKLKKYNSIKRGVLIDYSDEWTLICYNPVDYVLDGRLLIRNDVIKSFRIVDKKALDSKILLKKFATLNFNKLNIKNDLTLLNSLTKNKDFVGFLDNKINSIKIGIISKGSSIDNFFLQPLSISARWQKKTKIDFEKIEMIEMNSDYINSLKLYLKK